MKNQLSILLLASAFSFSATAVSNTEVQEAKVVTVNTKTAIGYLNVANGRNCLTENVQGKPSLLACDTPVKGNPESFTVSYIVLKSGKCLSDDGRGFSGIETCNYQDTKQQWKTLEGTQTEVRNVASNKCLTAAGLNNPVKIAACSGIPAQSWKLP